MPASSIFDHGLTPTYDRVNYDDLFSGKVNLLTDLTAAAHLGFAPVAAAAGDVADTVSGWFRTQSRGLFDSIHDVAVAADGWHAGMVAEWDQKAALRTQLRQRLLARIKAFDPDVIAAHSLGSIICYEAFTSTEGKDACKGRYLLTFGCQIANPFLKAAHFGNKIRGVGQRHWFNLFNKGDRVLTHRITDPIPDFEEIGWDDSVSGHNAVTDQANPDFADHPGYLQRDQTWQSVYQPLAETAAVAKAGNVTTRSLDDAPAFAKRAADFRKSVSAARSQRRALLIGINNYASPAIPQLAGCANDVFLMSSVLQEIGFDAEHIRVVLDARATRASILERIDWLLDGVGDGQERLLYFSGHGAQLPIYNSAEVIDHVNECLVPHDFSWTEASAITDDVLLRYYAGLPYSAKFYAIFDCCHSGGLSRSAHLPSGDRSRGAEGASVIRGGQRTVRAATPPDDIRHRMLRWNPDQEMWEERDLRELSPADQPPDSERSAASLNDSFGGGTRARKTYMGQNGCTKRLFRAMSMRQNVSESEYNAVKRATKGKRPGPYMPVVLEACQENASAYEYHHGVAGYGVFTYALAKEFRKAQRSADWGGLVRHPLRKGECNDGDAAIRPAMHPRGSGGSPRRPSFAFWRN